MTYDSGGFQAFSIGATDINGDGKPDVAVVNGGSQNVGILFGNGDGTFQPAVTYVAGAILGTGPRSLALADVNGDGAYDLILASCAGSGSCGATHGFASVLLGNGNGTFQPAVTYGSGGFSAWAVAAADVNGDGTLDLVVANQCGATDCTNGSVGVLLNNTVVRSPTSTSLSSNLNPSIYGQKVTWTAKVTTSGSTILTGKVKFTWSGHTIGSSALNSSGLVTLTKSNLNAFTYPLTAVYSGDTNNFGSTSTILSQIVEQTTSDAKLMSSPNPSTVGQAVTFTANITSPTVTAMGPVTFTLGKTTLGTVQLSGGKATFTTSSLPAGSNMIKVTYNGNSNVARSSAVVTQVVEP